MCATKSTWASSAAIANNKPLVPDGGFERVSIIRNHRKAGSLADQCVCVFVCGRLCVDEDGRTSERRLAEANKSINVARALVGPNVLSWTKSEFHCRKFGRLVESDECKRLPRPLNRRRPLG